MPRAMGDRAVRPRFVLLALTVVAICLTFRLHRFGAQDPPALHGAEPDAGSLSEYCHPPVEFGAEGVPPAAALELRAVVLAIRHGDRSAVHSPFPGRLKRQAPGFDCSPKEFEELWKELPQRYRVVNPSTGLPIRRSFRPLLRNGSASRCQKGQLTARGFRQHMLLGEHLHKSYRPFLASLKRDGGQLYARSTDYQRTIASAAALLSSLLPFWPVRIDLQVNPNQSAEIMHGVGLTNPAQSGDDGGEVTVGVGASCPAAVQKLMAQYDSWVKSGRTAGEYRRLQEIFGDPILNKRITVLSDTVRSLSCHRLPLPCGSSGCIGPELAAALNRRADEFFCERYAGAKGGSEATQLVFYPFMQEVLGRLQAAASPGASLAFAVLSGHDTVIAPVLAALGAYRGPLCRWPPYASRLALELYRSQESGDHFVRVVYNGEALRGVRGCGGEEACRLEDFAAGVASMLGGAPDLATACAP